MESATSSYLKWTMYYPGAAAVFLLMLFLRVMPRGGRGDLGHVGFLLLAFLVSLILFTATAINVISAIGYGWWPNGWLVGGHAGLAVFGWWLLRHQDAGF